MIYFFDANLSRQLVEGMKAFGEACKHVTDDFHDDVKDEEILEFVGRAGMVLITRDMRQRRTPAEKAAFQKWKVGTFYLSGKQLGSWAIIQQVVRCWPQIKDLSEKTQRPFAFSVPPHGTSIDRLT